MRRKRDLIAEKDAQISHLLRVIEKLNDDLDRARMHDARRGLETRSER